MANHYGQQGLITSCVKSHSIPANGDEAHHRLSCLPPSADVVLSIAAFYSSSVSNTDSGGFPLTRRLTDLVQSMRRTKMGFEDIIYER